MDDSLLYHGSEEHRVKKFCEKKGTYLLHALARSSGKNVPKIVLDAELQ
jgi:hypothetical protein